MLATFAIICLGIAPSGSQTHISLPPGLYTYKDIAAELKKAGIVLRTAAAPEDILVVSIKSQPISSFTRALETAGDVQLVSRGDSYEILSNAHVHARLARLAEAFQRDYAARVGDQLQEALGRYRHVAEAPPGSRAERLEALIRAASPAVADEKARANAKLALDFYYGNVPSSTVAIAVQQLRRGQVFRDRTIQTTQLSMQPDLYRDADSGAALEHMMRAGGIAPNAEALQRAFDATAVHDKASLDPLTGFLSSQVAVCPPIASPGYAGNSLCVVPDLVSVKCVWQSYLNTSERRDLEVRRQATKQFLSMKPFQLPAQGPHSSRLSQRILAWAKQSNADVVLRVGSYADLNTVAKQGDSFESWFRPLTEGRLPQSTFTAVREAHASTARSVEEAVLVPAVDYTIQNIDGVWVINDELRFRDKVFNVPSTLFVALLKAASGGPPSLDDLVNLAPSPFEKLDDSAAPQVFDAYGDVYGALPFLRLLHKDASLRKQVQELTEGKVLEKRIGSLTASQQRAFYQDIRLAVSLRVPGKWKPLSPLRTLHNAFGIQPFSSGMLEVSCVEGASQRKLTFAVRVNGIEMWSAHIAERSRE